MSTSASGRERGPAWQRLPGWLRRLTDLGTVPSDSEGVRLRKSVLTLGGSPGRDTAWAMSQEKPA